MSSAAGCGPSGSEGLARLLRAEFSNKRDKSNGQLERLDTH
jgi:hypothetical protein